MYKVFDFGGCKGIDMGRKENPAGGSTSHFRDLSEDEALKPDDAAHVVARADLLSQGI